MLLDLHSHTLQAIFDLLATCIATIELACLARIIWVRNREDYE